MKRCMISALCSVLLVTAQEQKQSTLLERMSVLEEQVLEHMHDQKRVAALYIEFAKDNWKTLKVDRQYEIHRMGGHLILLAAAFGHVQVVKALLKQGVAVDTQTYFGKTALFYAIENRHIAIIKLLLDYGADSTWRSKYNETPISLSAGWQECSALLAMYSKIESKHRL